MSKRAEEAAMKAYPKEEGKMYSTAFGTWEFDRNAAERRGFQEGYELAEKDLGWRSVKESLPPVDEEVIVLIPYCGDAAVKTQYEIAVAKLIQPIQCVPIGEKIWNIPGVKFWMPMPEIPEEYD